jgi:hypothetical protein
VNAPRAALLLAALAALAGPSPAAGDSASGIVAAAPARNWALQIFTPEGYRSMSLRGSEVRAISSARIDVVGINITTFSGDAQARVDSSLLSSAATFFPRENRATGDESVRVIRYSDDGGIVAEMTGEDWTYRNDGKKVSIRRNAHVVFMEQLADVLK